MSELFISYIPCLMFWPWYTPIFARPGNEWIFLFNKQSGFLLQCHWPTRRQFCSNTVGSNVSL